MADIENCMELEGDIDVCMIDDEEKVIKDSNPDDQSVNDDNIDQMQTDMIPTPASVTGNQIEDVTDQSQNCTEEMSDSKKLSSDCSTHAVSKPTAALPKSLLQNSADRIYQDNVTDDGYGVTNESYDKSNNSSSSSSEDDDDDDYDSQDDVFKRFYFESDHLAFKHNKDYKNLLKSLIMLEAERMSSVKDLEELQIWKRKALKDPISFVESLRSNNPPKLPERKQLPALPTIDWMQYLTSTEMVNFAHNFKVKTRRSFRSKGDRDRQEDLTRAESGLEDENECAAFESALDQGRIIRGKGMDDSKSMSFNRLWTNEEQEKLEKLLQIYPPEEVEARRWEKIARALGNRTPKQVSSRVQKYFIKLARAGLPIPGRVPHLTTQRKSKINPVSYRNSTFFPSWKPSIYMNDDDEDETSSVTTIHSDDTPHVSDDEMIPSDVKDSAEYKELMDLKRFRKELKEAKTKCSSCGMKPIRGPQYRCSDCSEEQSYHLCGQCMDRNKHQSSTVHPKWHQMVLVGKSSSFVDGDYMSFELQQGKYNYLDPNFTPNVR